MSQRPLDAYSALKATRHLDIIENVREGRPVRPAHVEIILSDLCNHACNFCAYRDPTYTSSQMFYEVDETNLKKGLRRDAEHPERNYNPNRMIPYAKVLEILDDCVRLGVSGIQWTGGGEPTVHPKFNHVIAETLARHLPFSLVSNGCLIGKRFTDEDVDWLAHAAWIRISLDAGAKETYARMRSVPESQFEDALSAIRRLRAARDRLGTNLVLGVGFVVTPDNWCEVEIATRLAKEVGADNIRISAQFSAKEEALFADFHEECAALCKSAVAEHHEEGRFQVYDRFSQKLEDLRLKRPDYPKCGYQHFTTYIGADLNVYRCCVFAYHPHGLIGSLKEQRFADFWMSKERTAEMARFSAESCDRCQFNGINRNLDYILREEDPPHSEFV